MKQKRRILSILITLMMVISLLPASVFGADDESTGKVVISFEYYDRETDTIVLLRNPEAVEFTASDTGVTLAEKLLGAENVGISGGWMNSFTIDEIEYTPKTFDLGDMGSWSVYKNGIQDSVGPADYKPTDGDVYRFALTTYDDSYMMPKYAVDTDALYWAAATSESSDLTSVWSLIQSCPTQAAVDAKTAEIAPAGGSHYVIVDGRSVQLTSDWTFITTLTVDKTSAAKGETVTVTLSVPGGMDLVEGSLKAGGPELTKQSDTTYTFVMPDYPVYVTADFQTASNLKLQSAAFYYDEDGEKPITIEPAFDPDTTEYSISFTDQGAYDDDCIYFIGVFDEDSELTAQWYASMMGYQFENKTVSSGEMTELDSASFFWPGMSNGEKHRLDIKAPSGATAPYSFTMTALPTLESIEIDGEELEDFDFNTSEYSLTLTGAESVTINAAPFADFYEDFGEDAPEVFLNDGEDDIAGVDTKVELEIGKNTITLTVVGSDDAENTYTIEITVKEPGVADPIEINATIDVRGEVMVPAMPLTVEDVDKDDAITAYDALYAAHKEFCEGGAEGFGVSDSGWITKFWGEDGAAVGYYVNNASLWSITDPVAEGDYLVAFIYKDADKYSDGYGKLTGTANDDGTLTLTLEKEDWSTGSSAFVAVPDASIKAYDSSFKALAEDAYTVTDNEDGTYTVKFTESGDYIIAAFCESPLIVPPVFRESVTVPENQGDDVVPEKNDIEDIFNETCDALYAYGEENGFAQGDEWVVLGLARAGVEIPGKDDYIASVEEYVGKNANDKEQIGNISSDNSKMILTLTALGEDVTDVAGHDLTKGLSDLTFAGKQGLNGYGWELLALDSHEYETAEDATATRDALVDAILAKQHDDGGWSLSEEYPSSDVDVTAMMIQALAPYYSENADVKAAVDEALDWLSGVQDEYGGFASMGTPSSESCAQVIVALTALGIDPASDERFVKNDWSVVDALSSYYLGDGEFSHTQGGDANGMAREQSFYAMVAYFRFMDSMTSLYDMTDVTIGEDEEEAEDPIVSAVDEAGEEIEYRIEEVEESIILTKGKAAEVNDKVEDPEELTIIWQGDVAVPDDTEFPVVLTFAIPEDHQGDTIYVYHYNGTDWEVVGEGSGETVEASFDELSPVGLVAQAAPPPTGDANDAFLWAGLCVIAVAAAAVTVFGRKRREE